MDELLDGAFDVALNEALGEELGNGDFSLFETSFYD